MTSEGWRDCGIPEPRSLRSSPEHGASLIASEHKRYRRTTPTALTRILRLARAGEKRVRPVVDGNINETGSVRFQCFSQDGVQFRRMFDAKASEPERLREIGKVRVAELGADGAVELRHLLPPDATQSTVAEHEVHRRSVLAPRGLQLMDAHEEPAIPAHRHDPTVRIHQLRGDPTRHGNAHRGKAVRDDGCLGFLDSNEPAEPELVGTHV